MMFTAEMFQIHTHDLLMVCMNEEMGKLIGSAIGQVRDCDVDKDGKAWDQTLCTYIEIEIHKPLPRGRILNLSGNKTWILLTYEKLPKFLCG